MLLDSEEALERLFTALDSYRQQHQRLAGDRARRRLRGGRADEAALFAGGGKQRPRWVTADQIDIITGALAGTANKTLLAWAIKHQINAVGLSLGGWRQRGRDPARSGIGPRRQRAAGSPALLNTLLSAGYLPVVSSIGITAEGQLMNVNADQAATALAATLGADSSCCRTSVASSTARATHCGNDGAKSGTTDRARHHHRWYGGEGECGARRGHTSAARWISPAGAMPISFLLCLTACRLAPGSA
ncbi:hypothetical protein J4732_21790 [Serratia marcescens]|uniref:acetylglutamate kinase n=1 Tax=Serratia marcescens TaxID=615 RepID=A0A939NTF7_SERMA|nr:hypothetical protein [Serratia marcescens]